MKDSLFYPFDIPLPPGVPAGPISRLNEEKTELIPRHSFLRSKLGSRRTDLIRNLKREDNSSLSLCPIHSRTRPLPLSPLHLFFLNFSLFNLHENDSSRFCFHAIVRCQRDLAVEIKLSRFRIDQQFQFVRHTRYSGGECNRKLS